MELRKDLGAALALLSFAAACTAPAPPPRAPGIPASARWAGGSDGGSWIDCREGDEAGVFHCAVFHESSGEKLVEGIFQRAEAGPGGASAPLAYSAFDGDRILLSGGGSLEPRDAAVLGGSRQEEGGER